MLHFHVILRYVTLLLAVFTFSACNNSQQHKTTLIGGETMGTSWSVKITDLPHDVDAATLQLEFESELQAINASMSTYIEDSEISRINKLPANKAFDLSDQLLTVLSEAQRISLLSDGAFDITIGPLVNLWGFGPTSGTDSPPDDKTISDYLIHTGFNKLTLDVKTNTVLKRDPALYLDLSAIAKGFAVDRLSEILDQRDISDYMIEIGGELKLRGINSRGEPWVIAVEEPNPNARSALSIVQPGRAAIATSGDYRNYFEHEGLRYSHTIDPRTGKPIAHQLASVSVIHQQCTTADALATALMVLGPELGLETAEKNNLAAFFVVKTTEGFATVFTEQFKPYLTQP